MLGMLKRHEVEILLKAGHPKVEVARLAGVSLCSVKRIAEEVPVVHVDDAAEREKRRIGRPSIVEDFRKPVLKILEEKPDLPSLEILRRVRESGYQGGKTALYALVASVRPKEIKPLTRFEGLPGEFSQHDFGEVDVAFLDGSSRRIHFFASRLKYSRLMRVSVVKDQTVESLRDQRGFVCAGRDLTTWKLTRHPFPLETSLPGVFSAGDVRHNSIKRVSSGVGEGSMAIAFIHQYLSL